MVRHQKKEIFVGSLPRRVVTKKKLEDVFKKFGAILEIDLRMPEVGGPFAFIQFEDPRDAEDAVMTRDGCIMDGYHLRVEYAHGHQNCGGSRHTGRRVVIKGLPESTTWQYLKDYIRGRVGDGVIYTNINKDGNAFVEFRCEEDVDRAIRKMNHIKFRGLDGDNSIIRVTRCRRDNRATRDRRRSRSGERQHISTERPGRRSRDDSSEIEHGEKSSCRERERSQGGERGRSRRGFNKDQKIPSRRERFSEDKNRSRRSNENRRKSSSSNGPTKTKDHKKPVEGSRSRSPKDKNRQSRSRSRSPCHSSRSRSPCHHHSRSPSASSRSSGSDSPSRRSWSLAQTKK